MPVVSREADSEGYPALAYDCPGCRQRHVLRLRGDAVPGETWAWNGNDEEPTVYPAVHFPDCHHQIRDGKIHFLSSSQHVFAGQLVAMKEVWCPTLPSTPPES